MKKRILAVLLVLALVVVAGVVAVSATETGPTISEEVGNVQCPCGCGLIKDIDDWQEWSTFNSRLATGHYYLTGDKTGVARTLIGETSKVLLNLNGHNITHGSGYRGITVYSGGTATLIGEGTISAYAASAGVIDIGAGSTFNLYEATIKNINTDTTKTSAATAVTLGSGTSTSAKTIFNMYSGELHCGVINSGSNNGGTVAVNSYGEFYMYGGTLYAGGAGGKNGNGVYVGASSSKFVLDGGHLVGSGLANRGGGVYMANGAFTMKSGKITGFKAGRGAGVFVAGGTFTMEDGEISGNTSTGNTATGMAIDVFGGTLNVKGGTISSDIAAGTGTIHSKATVNISGGVVDGNICSSTVITVSGAPKIADVDLVTADLDKLAAATTIAIGADGLSEGASIGVTKTHGQDFTAALTTFTGDQRAQFANYFYSTTPGYSGAVNPETDALYLVKKCPDCGYAGEWTHITADTVLELVPQSYTDTGSVQYECIPSGHYILDADYNAPKVRNVLYDSDDLVHIDLNGYNWNVEAGVSAFWVRNGDLAIMDLSAEQDGMMVTEANANNGGVIYMTTGNFDLYSGTLKNTKTDVTREGGAVAINGSGKFHMHGGKIVDSNAKNGGAIYLATGTVTISGGTIENCSATAYGGAVHMISGTFNMTGGTIKGCTAVSRGGNIHITSGTMTVDGDALIEDGNCTYVSDASNDFGGGNFYVVGGNAILNVKGGTIQNGTAGATAGNILLRTGTVNISGGKILGGTSNCYADSIGYRANLNISGGYIDGEVAPQPNATIGTLVLSGDPQILNLNLNQYVSGTTTYSPVVTIGELSGADIKVQATEGVAFTSVLDAETVETVKANFSAYDATRYEVANNDDFALVLNKWGEKAPCYCEEHKGEEIIWTVLADEHIFTGGSYKRMVSDHYILTENFNAPGRVVLTDVNNWSNVAINLNGHNWTYVKDGEMPFWLRTEESNGYAAGNLFVTDTSTNKSGAIIGGAATYQQGGGVVRMTGGVFTLHSGTVKFDSATSATVPGGAIDLAAGAAKFVMNGGSVIGADTTGKGKAILVSGGCELQLNGGSVSVPDGADCNDVIYQAGSSKLIIGENNANVDSLSGKIYMEAAVNADGRGVACIQKVADTENEKTEQVWYKDAATAAENVVAENVHYIKLLADGLQTLPTDVNYYVDINGKTANISGAALCFDSANDGFDAEACGTVTMVDPASYVNAPNGNLYITVSEGEGQYSFHRLDMQFEKLSLRPSTAGIYYSSIWNGDEVLVGNKDKVNDLDYAPIITGYGMALRKNEAADSDSFDDPNAKFAYTYFPNAEGITSNFLAFKKDKEINSCLLSNIINKTNSADTNKENAQVPIYATPYVAITNYNDRTEYVMGPVFNWSLKQIVEWVVTEISDAEASKLQPLYDNFCVDQPWGLVDFFEGLADLVNTAE